MKRKFLIKLSSAILFFGTIVTAIPASATTYYSGNFSGGNDDGDNVILGSGTRYVYGECTKESGEAQARMVVEYAPDSIVGKFYLWNVGESGKDRFYAYSQASNGDDQEYYIHWEGAKDKGKAWLALSN